MSQEKGILTTCECCETSVFRKLTGRGETDGGYTVWDKFEPLPNDWLYVGGGMGYLCPRCTSEFKNLMFNFIEQDKLPKEWRLMRDEEA